MKRLLLLSLLILALLTPAVLAEEAEPVWKDDEIIGYMTVDQTAAVPAANAAAGTVSLTASKTTALVSEMVTLTISAPGASAVRLYDYYGENNWNLWRERNDSTLSLTYAANSARTDRYFATACFDGEWTAEPGELITVTFDAEGTLVMPAYNMPGRANAGEAFIVEVSEVPHATEYGVLIYRTVDGRWQSVAEKRQENAGTFEFTVYDPGEYNVDISAYGLGWNTAAAHTLIIIGGDDSPVPTVTLLSDPNGTYYLGSTVRVRVELEGATEFISRQGSREDYDTSYPAENGAAVCDVAIRSSVSNKSEIRFRALVNGNPTGFSETIAVPVATIPAPSLSFADTVEQGAMLSITASNLPEHWRKTNVFIRDENGDEVFNGNILDRDNPTIVVDTLAMEPGNYTVYAFQNITDTSTGSRRAELPLTVTASSNPPAVGTIRISVSAETLYAGNSVTVSAYAPGADRVRICRGTPENFSEQKTNNGAACSYSIQYNAAATVEWFAQAAYNGGDWSVTSEVKQVEFISRGRLEAPTFDCKTEFAVGEPITITRTNTVENAETYVAFLSKEDHTDSQNINFKGANTVSFRNGVSEPGTYIVSVVAMAPGWSNNQTDLTITVTEAADDHCGENVTWSLSDDGTLTISGTGKMFSYYSEATPWGYDIKKVIVEPGVTVVGGNAFMNCYNLKSVQLPAGLKRIGQRAFSYCYNMEEVNLPDSLESIGACAFMGCEQLIEVVIPAGIENIGFGTFQSCVNIKKVSLPTGLTRIGKYAFASCLSLEALVIPDSVTDIDSYAFVGGRDLKAIRLPDTISHIGEDIFGGSDVAVFCNSASATSQWAKGQGLTVFPLDKNIIVLPEDIKTVESEAFAGLSEPTTVVIPDTVEYIARDAFSGSTVAIRANDGTEGANYAYQRELPRFPD
ncbi:MAG: leucine-rich repeat domain-containing protein [Clostridia bacterium]|nr:leucine-rich repeat domain-containing protein [Clostridia bacterium]